MINLVTHSADETRALGARMGAAVQKGGKDPLVIALDGELGAGKTTLVGGFLQALGVRGAVRSPTYTLIEPYELGDRTVYHMDLYRLANPSELDMVAPRDLLHDGAVLLVEWSERGGAVLPKPDLRVRIGYSADPSLKVQRHVEIAPETQAGQVLAAALQSMPNEVRLSP